MFGQCKYTTIDISAHTQPTLKSSMHKFSS